MNSVNLAKSEKFKSRQRLGSMLAIAAACWSFIQTAQVIPSPSNPTLLSAIQSIDQRIDQGVSFELPQDDRDDLPTTNSETGNAIGKWLNQFNPFKSVPAPVPSNAWIQLPIQTGRSMDQLFANNTQSLVAKAVGAAEGTRRPDGGINRAYYGHVDPGNAVWNVGTFSYQHCGKCAPEEADRRQLSRLARQFEQIRRYAQTQYQMNLSLEEQLNAIDLANQAPLAALSDGGFIDRLRQAKARGLQGSNAILQARVYSYKNPSTGLWEAPGLGNTLSRITHDQARRQEAIARAIQLHL
jgi:hypothetical protein